MIDGSSREVTEFTYEDLRQRFASAAAMRAARALTVAAGLPLSEAELVLERLSADGWQLVRRV